MFKVVIVEDELVIRKALRYAVDWLALDCCVTAEAGDGREGLAAIEEHEPDLIVTDIRIPFLSGIEMLEIARLKHEFESIILTSYGEFEYAQKAISLRVVDYILKPIDEAKLYAAIEKAVGIIREKRARSEPPAAGGTAQGASIELYESLSTDYYVRKTLRYMAEHSAERISIKSIAAMLDISPSYLSRKFHQETSQTFLNLLTSCRIQKAVDIIRRQGGRLYDISEAVGFTDYRHFCTAFKRVMNMTPREFLQKYTHLEEGEDETI